MRTTLELTRVWAALTGIVLAVIYFAQVAFGNPAQPLLALLVAGIGGFELVLYVQDVVLRRGGSHG